jgi:hypothetical protein
MFTRPASIAAVFTVACAAAGCTTTEPTTITADSTPPIAAADFGPQLASTLCAVWVRCGLYEEMAECVAASPGASSFRPSDVAADIANGTLDYEGSLAADCIDKIAATACSDVALNPDFDWLVTAECGQFMLGTLSDGSACTRDEQCGVNSNCLPDPNGPSSGIDLPGTCTPIDNRICGPDNPPCPGNEVCAPGGVCGGDGGAGSSCGDDIDCVKGLVCTGLVDAYGPTGNGTCVPPPGAGASCDGVCDALGLSLRRRRPDRVLPSDHAVPARRRPRTSVQPPRRRLPCPLLQARLDLRHLHQRVRRRRAVQSDQPRVHTAGRVSAHGSRTGGRAELRRARRVRKLRPSLTISARCDGVELARQRA